VQRGVGCVEVGERPDPADAVDWGGPALQVIDVDQADIEIDIYALGTRAFVRP
jgi:hypothetical protein